MTRRRAVSIGATLSAVVVAWAVFTAPDRAYRAYVAELRAAGEAVDYDGLVGAPVPPGEDGGPELEAAHQWMKDNVPYERWNSVVGGWNPQCDATWAETSTPEQLAELTKFLCEIEPYLAGLRRAAAKPRLTLRTKPRDEFGFPQPAAATRMQQAGHVLCAAAVGRTDEESRLDSIATLLACSIHVERKTLIGHLIAAACARSASAEVRRALEHGRLEPSAARARLDPLLREQWLAGAPEALRGDRVFVIQAYQSVIDGRWPDHGPTLLEKIKSYATTGGPPPRTFPFTFDPPSARDTVAQCRALSAAMRVPVGTYDAYRRAVDEAASPYAVAKSDWAEIGKWLGILAGTDAATRLARVALAAGEYRATHGDFPASLDELKPMFADGVPLDPFTDAPFVYERTATGVRIASQGRLTDETPLDEETLREKCLVWELKK